MKKERILAGLLLAALAVLAVRAAVGWPVSQEAVPVVLDVSQPFYPVYFGSRENGLLAPEFHQGTGTVEEVLAHLLAGPSLEQLISVIPAETVLLGYRQSGETLYVSFSHHLVTNHPGGSTGEILTVYSIVNSLTDLDGIEQVQILVENQVIDTLAGHLNLQRALRKDHTALGSSVL
ncbi:MAG TPA: GerMN domain-containing protein [Limnochordia bacterium]|nr:GerMN domain-containing protein [Limnochordia bacterium]